MVLPDKFVSAINLKQ